MPITINAAFLRDLSEEARALSHCNIPESTERALLILAAAAEALRLEMDNALRREEGAVILLRALDGGRRRRQHVVPARRYP